MDKSKKLPIAWTDPELLTSRQATLECDVWSFGIMLYEIICEGKDIPKCVPSKQKEFEENFPMPEMKKIKESSIKKLFFNNLHQEFMKPCLNFHRGKRPSISSMLDKLEQRAQDKGFEAIKSLPEIEMHGKEVNYEDRDWATIIKESKSMNIIELHISKSDNVSVEPSLVDDEISTFIFDVLKIRRVDCLAFDYDTGNPNKKYLQIKEEVKLDENIFYTEKYFKKHTFEVFPLRNRRTKVTFHNVPLFIPDEEITNLARTRGTPVGPVKKLKMTNRKNKGVTGSIRVLNVILNDGIQFETYYWIEDPLINNKQFRIWVSHMDQEYQCPNCLMKYPECMRNSEESPCLNPVTNPNMYMQWIEKTTGYTSLKKKNQLLSKKDGGDFNKIPTFGDFVQQLNHKPVST